MRNAEDGAGFAMRKIGKVPPTFLAATPSGPLTLIPSMMADERDKDKLANSARLICFLAHYPDRCRGLARLRRVRWTARGLVRGALRGADAGAPGDDRPTGARPPTPRRDGSDRGGAQRNAGQQLKPPTACRRFRGGPGPGARNRDGAARPPQSAEETDQRTAGANWRSRGRGNLGQVRAGSAIGIRRFSSSEPRPAWQPQASRRRCRRSSMGLG